MMRTVPKVDVVREDLFKLRDAVGGLMLLLCDKGLYTAEELEQYINEYKKKDTEEAPMSIMSNDCYELVRDHDLSDSTTIFTSILLKSFTVQDLLDIALADSHWQGDIMLSHEGCDLTCYEHRISFNHGEILTDENSQLSEEWLDLPVSRLAAKGGWSEIALCVICGKRKI